MAKGKRKNGRINKDGFVEWSSAKLDGWANVLTGLGTSRDKRTGNQFQRGQRITHSEMMLEDQYHGDDLVARIVDLPPQEMYREWIDLTAASDEAGDTDQELSALILQDLDALHAQKHFTDAEAWSRLYGGALILMGVDDGTEDPAEPLRMDSVQSIKFLSVLNRHEVQVEKYYDDALGDKFGQPELYRLTGSTVLNASSGTSEVGGTFGELIHETRTIRFDGGRMSRRRRRENNGWGDSVLERYNEVIRDFQGASGGIMHLLQDFSQAVFKIKGLAKLLAADKDDVVLKRLSILDIGRSIVRAVPLDSEEDFERKGANVAGMADLYDRMMMRVSAATGIPVTLLFGRSPAGMNATGESDIRLFYDHIASLQETTARPRLEYLLEILLSAKEGPTGGTEPASWNFTWNPLFQETSKEQAETRLAVAKADDYYLRNGVLSENEVAQSRFGGDTYSPDTMLDDEERALAEAVEEEVDDVIEPEQEQLDEIGYKLNIDGSNLCSTCVYTAGTTKCSKHGFTWDAGHKCDSYGRMSPLVRLKGLRADGKKQRAYRSRGRGKS